MLFLLFALAASCHAYAVYPIDENVDETFNAILKIFRLEFLGVVVMGVGVTVDASEIR